MSHATGNARPLDASKPVGDAHALALATGSAMPRTLWAYYTNGGKTLKYSLDKKHAEESADGFTWDNPRVRAVGKIIPLPNNKTCNGGNAGQ